MNTTQLRPMLIDFAQMYFDDYTVIWANSKAVKPSPPFVTLNLRNLQRPLKPIEIIRNGEVVGVYANRITLEVNLFTKGDLVEIAGYDSARDNSSVAELLGFAGYINSPDGNTWLSQRDISIQQEGDVQDVSDIIDDQQYQYRSMAEFLVDFTEEYGPSTQTGWFEHVEITEMEE